MSERKKAAIIGCGTISGAHGKSYKLISDRVELKYFCDLIPERAEARKKEFGEESSVVTTDYRDILRDPEVDMISVCLPNRLHAPVTIDCLNAGKDVLCEKPASTSYELALSMKNAADRNGRILNIGVVNRFSTSVERIKSLISSGEIGELYQIYCSFRAFRSIPALGKWFTTKSEAGGGALIDWGVHFLDLIDYCCGGLDLKTVSAVCHSKLGRDIPGYLYRSMHAGPPDPNGTYDVEEYVTGLVRTSGPALTINGAWAQNIDEDAMFVEFMGTKGGIKLFYGSKFKVFTSAAGELITVEPKLELNDAFAAEIDAFVRCCGTREKIRSNIDNVLTTSKLMDAIYSSAELGQEIGIN
ncbi:MAG: Gfo/Idh/MocA family protein [Eubacteriales bacterium]